MINKKSKIFLAGHNGMLGSSILKNLKKNGYNKIITINKKRLDLRNQSSVQKFFKSKKPEGVIIAAAKVGGIKANINFPAEFINENLQIQINLINASLRNNVKKLIFFGASCIYPKNFKRPIKEQDLLTGALEKTNESYAIAKIAGIQMINSFNKQYNTKYICLMPCNLFGQNDNYDLENSHFLPALIKKIDKLKNTKKNTLLLWGNGKAKREVIYVDDIANACVYFMNKKKTPTVINIGTGKDYSIEYFAKLISKIILPQKKIIIKYDLSKPNGNKRKVMDVSLAKKLGWTYVTDIEKAISLTYHSYQKEKK